MKALLDSMVARFSGKRPDRSQIFKEYRPFSGMVKAGFGADYIGQMTNHEFEKCFHFDKDSEFTAGYPIVSEEYFEWIDILESARDARKTNSYTIAELGAGFGRWSARALKAAEQMGVQASRAILIEAEPQHAAWIPHHMANNGIDPSRFVLHEAAIAAKAGKQQMLVVAPNNMTAQEWYGQSLNSSAGMSQVAESQRRGEYHGKPLYVSENGWGAIEVECMTLKDTLPAEGIIDLVDIDIQGAEAEVIESGIDLLSARVRRLHIGTHSHDVENRIRAVFKARRWQPVWDFPCLSEVDTPYGKVPFGDGVQGWINPKLAL